MAVADGFPSVAGHCPSCRSTSLFLGSGGHVTCARLDCSDPCAADRLLHRSASTNHGTLQDVLRAQLTDVGYTRESVDCAIAAEDFNRLEHTGRHAVRLRTPA